jgi:hypothetical protein
MKYWTFAITVSVCLKNRTLTQLVVGKTQYEAWHTKKPFLKDLPGLGSLAFIHVAKVYPQTLDYRATPGTFIVCNVLTQQDFIYDPLAKTLLYLRDVVFTQQMRYAVRDAPNDAILNNHFY